MTEITARLKAALADRYAIEREIGSGGMATVYLAEDLKHHRKVAVKVLRPELATALNSERFLREIEIAANLAHPHILPLHDSGQVDGFLYYVMPYIEGESLRDRLVREKQLAVDDAIDITRQVARALGYAHDRNVIHRDIKPGNILLAGGEAVVADFGIARAFTAAGDERLTETGFAIGTPIYMSPEQASGASELDGRTDIYSLACVLYEMLGGDPPFLGSSAQTILARKSLETAPSVRVVRETVSEGLDAAISKALATGPVDRFATAHEFSAALESSAPQRPVARGAPSSGLFGWGVAAAVGVLVLVLGVRGFLSEIGRGPVLGDRSVAVLPCVNLSGDPGQEYFSDGVTEQITSHLSALTVLKVKSILSVLRFRDTEKGSREIGGELGAGMLVRCNANRVDSVLHVGVQLIDVEDDASIWGHEFSGALREFYSITADAAIGIAEALATTVTPDARASLAKEPTESQEALDLYQRGRYFWNSGSLDGLQRALGYYRQAVTVDSGFAMAYVGLADVFVSLVGRWFQPTHENFARARGAVHRAISLDSGLAEAHAVLGRIRHRYEWDWKGAEESFQRARSLKPNDWQAELDYAKLLSSLGRHDEAIGHGRRAVDLAPLVWINSLGLGSVLYFARRYDEAINQIEETIELDLDNPFPHIWHGLALVEVGRPDEARAAIERAVRLTKRHTSSLAVLGYVLGRTGRRAEARRILEELRNRLDDSYVSPVLVFAVHAGLGEADSAFAWIDRGYQNRDWNLADLAVHPIADLLRSDVRMASVLGRMGLNDVTVPNDGEAGRR